MASALKSLNSQTAHKEQAACGEPFVVPLVRKLAAVLDEQAIAYCQWKGNRKIHRWGRAEGDIDLLVARRDAQRLEAILAQLGFKHAKPRRGFNAPGISNYYGLDAEQGCIVHLHVYYRLVLEGEMSRDYRLPIEQPLIEHASKRNLFFAPPPEFQLVLLVLRAVLQHSIIHSAARSLFGKRAKDSSQELALAQAEADPSRTREILNHHFAYIPSPLFDECRESLNHRCSIWKRYAIKRRLEKRLNAEATSGRLMGGWAALLGGVSQSISARLLRRSFKKHLTSGGAIIAVTGGDGSGKSTCVKELSRWLTAHFDTKDVHMGKPQWSLATFTLSGLIKVCGLLGSRRQQARATLLDYLYCLYWMFVARDRYRLYAKIRRYAARGGLVICDRFPIASIRLMDGPKIRSALRRSRADLLTRLLQRREESYYRKILPPDLLLVLRLHPEIAVRRKADENPQHVRTRNRELWQADWRGTRAHLIDASRPLGEVLSELKATIWSYL